MDWTITLTLSLGAALTLALPLTVKVIRNRGKAIAKTKNGDVLIAQAPGGAKDAAAVAIKGNGNKVYTNTGNGSMIIAPSKYGETEKRAARKAIKQSFDGFFYNFLGSEKAAGMLNHSPNLDKNNPKMFASHYEQTARNTFRQAKAKLETALITYAPILEDANVEASLAEEFGHLEKIQDAFDITNELREKIISRICSILNYQK